MGRNVSFCKRQIIYLFQKILSLCFVPSSEYLKRSAPIQNMLHISWKKNIIKKNVTASPTLHIFHSFFFSYSAFTSHGRAILCSIHRCWKYDWIPLVLFFAACLDISEHRIIALTEHRCKLFSKSFHTILSFKLNRGFILSHNLLAIHKRTALSLSLCVFLSYKINCAKCSIVETHQFYYIIKCNTLKNNQVNKQTE